MANTETKDPKTLTTQAALKYLSLLSEESLKDVLKSLLEARWIVNIHHKDYDDFDTDSAIVKAETETEAWLKALEGEVCDTFNMDVFLYCCETDWILDDFKHLIPADYQRPDDVTEGLSDTAKSVIAAIRGGIVPDWYYVNQFLNQNNWDISLDRLPDLL